MLFSQAITIVASPLKMISLKLETLVTPNSGWMDVSSRHGKAILFRMNGNAYLYFSPFAKESFLKECNTPKLLSKPGMIKLFFWKSIDILDTLTTRSIKWLKGKFSKKSPPQDDSTYYPFASPTVDMKESEKLLKKRKDFINKLKKGKVADRVEVLSTSKYQGSIPSMKAMDESLRKSMADQMSEINNPASKVDDSLKKRFADILSKSMDETMLGNANEGGSIKEWSIRRSKVKETKKEAPSFDDELSRPTKVPLTEVEIINRLFGDFSNRDKFNANPTKPDSEQ